ncbi:MAG: SRPBCC family protein [Pirellulales bacterium]|nr:SRPBCC family protein [Pirellulales bacterium]
MTWELEGEEHFAAPVERVFALLTDLRVVADLIPDLESCEVDGQGMLRCVVRPGFSFLRGTLRLTIRIEPVPEAGQAVMHVTAEGIGTGMEVRSTLVLERSAGGTRLKWRAEVDRVRGLLAAVSPALIQAAAAKVMANGWEQLRHRLAASDTPPL